MPTESTLRPSSSPAVSSLQLVRRRSFGKVVRIDLVGPATAPSVLAQARAGDDGIRGLEASRPR